MCRGVVAAIAQYAKLVTKPAGSFFAGDQDNNIYFLVSGSANLALEKPGAPGDPNIATRRPQTALPSLQSMQMSWSEGRLAGVHVRIMPSSFDQSLQA